MSFILDGMGQAMGLLVSGNPETWSAVYATVVVTVMSVAASFVLGAPLGFLLGFYSFPGKRALRMIADTLLSFPTVVIGLIVYAMLSHRGPLGELGLLFTLPGVAIGMTLLGLPIVIALTANAVEYADGGLRDTLRTLGASSSQVFRAMLWEVRYHMLLAAMAAFGRIVSEVGISMMVGGNIKWHTRTITTAIALETGKGEFAMGIALGVVLMVIAFVVNLALAGLKRRTVTR